MEPSGNTLPLKTARRIRAVVLKTRRQRRPRRRKQSRRWHTWARLGTEAAALIAAALIGVIAVLGYLADWFGGSGWSHLLLFAGGILTFGLAMALFLRGWFTGRAWLAQYHVVLPAAAAVLLAIGAAWFARRPEFGHQVTSLRTLVGGTEEAERVAIAHQVYAAYRRADASELLVVLERARVYEPTVHEAATAFGMDAEVLMGIGAAESAFYPRDSHDGGRGLFQITAPPSNVVALVQKRLHITKLDPLNQRHNAFIAAATLRHYLAEMRGDLFLGLLAYNIGPRNGGLRSIMKQYGARDFVTIQPYLQHLPRDYPIRVLSAALAYRLWRIEGKLPRYEDGGNALHVQAVGIPGLQRAPELQAATPAHS